MNFKAVKSNLDRGGLVGIINTRLAANDAENFAHARG